MAVPWQLAIVITAAHFVGGLQVEAYAEMVAAASRGPFEIRSTVRSISSGAFPNRPNLFSRKQVSEWQLVYRGRPVSVEQKGSRFSEFYDVWFLDGAPKPAALMVLEDFYLVTEENGMVKSTLLSTGRENDPARYQWLDGQQGQPAEEQGVFVRDRRDETRALAGGTLLLLNCNAVLDVSSLRVYPVRAPLHDRSLWEYPVADQPAKALSPDKRQYVLVGGHETEGDARPALVVIDIQKDRGYIVPFDPQAIDAESIYDITPAWVQRQFTWTKQNDGSLRLERNRSAERNR